MSSRTNATVRLCLDATDFMPDQRKPTDHVRKDNGFSQNDALGLQIGNTSFSQACGQAVESESFCQLVADVSDRVRAVAEFKDDGCRVVQLVDAFRLGLVDE
jgi:hypothetical protein